MPEIIPYHDSTSELFDAYKTIQEVKQSAQRIAMDQALANQHIQSAQTLDQMNQARLQIEQQQAKEYTSPAGISSRARAQDTALAQGDANLNRTNQEIVQSDDLHPLIMAHQQQSARLARISADSAQQELNDLQDKLSDQSKLRKMTVDGMKYKMIQDGMDPHTSALMSQIKGEELTNQLKNLPKTFEAQATALDESVKQMQQKTQMNAGSMIEHAASVVNTVGADAAKGLFKDMPGYESMANMPSDAMRQGGNPKDQIFRMQVHLMKDPTTPDDVKRAIINTLGQQIAGQSGYKPPTAQEKMAAGLGIPGAVVDDSILKQSKVIAKHILEKTQVDPKTGDVLPPGYFDIQTPQGVLKTKDVGGEVQAGDYQIGKDGQVIPSTQPLKSSSGLPTGTQFEGQPTAPAQSPILTKEMSISAEQIKSEAIPEFNRVEKLIPSMGKDANQPFSAKRLDSGFAQRSREAFSGAPKDSASANTLILNSTDPKFTIDPDNGQVYDRTKTDSNKTSSPILTDKDFESRVSEYSLQGFDDKEATVAQSARFAAVMSQMAKAYQLGGKDSLFNVFWAANSKFKSGSMSPKQSKALAQLAADYGLTRDKRPSSGN